MVAIGRFSEVDSLRGLAACLMLASNLFTDLSFFGILHIPANYYLARITAFLFVFTAGLSLHLSYERALLKGKNASFSRYLRRGLLLFSLGMLITLVTLIFMEGGFIFFGILHFLGVSVVLGYFFLRFSAAQNLLLAAIFLFSGLMLPQPAPFPWLLWLGFIPAGFYSVDYFPLIPWFSFFLLGVAAGKALYPLYTRRFRLHRFNAGALSFIGRNTLAIYLVHQPVFIAILSLLFSQHVMAVLNLTLPA
jgi:uncharacterized membrane protein